MKQIKTLAVLALSMGMSVTAVAAPPDALINNSLSVTLSSRLISSLRIGS